MFEVQRAGPERVSKTVQSYVFFVEVACSEKTKMQNHLQYCSRMQFCFCCGCFFAVLINLKPGETSSF